MGIDLSGTTPADPSRPKGILELISEGIAGAGGIGGVLAGVVTGIVGGIVGAIGGIADLIGGLLNLGRRDTAAVDTARVEAENAIVEQMSASIDKLDEIQRFGGAYMDYPMFQFNYGEVRAHIIPLNAGVPLSRGTAMVAPSQPLTHSEGATWAGFMPADREQFRSRVAQGSGYLELMESGLWVIDFQAAVLQGSTHTDKPADVWCHITPAASPLIPTAAPGFSEDWDTIAGKQATRHRVTGAYSEVTAAGFVAAFGRGKSYVGVEDTQFGGGVTVGGRMFVYLQSPGWKVTLSGTAFRRYSGASSTYVTATKVNSENLRTEIDTLKAQIAAAFPGQPVQPELDEAAIAAMVATAAEIDVLSGEASSV